MFLESDITWHLFKLRERPTRFTQRTKELRYFCNNKQFRVEEILLYILISSVNKISLEKENYLLMELIKRIFILYTYTILFNII